MKYLLKFDISQPLDHDFGLSTEEYFSSAVHPPVHILVLENEQDLPQNVEVQASHKGSGIGVTVEDVLKPIGLDLRRSSSQREWAALNEDIRSRVEDAFEDRAQTEEERSGGLRRIDYLHGRNRLQVFPRHRILKKTRRLLSRCCPFIVHRESSNILILIRHSPTYTVPSTVTCWRSLARLVHP